MTTGRLTVTHPEASRYFMLILEAAGLILQAGAMGEGGEVFVLDMGEPVKILDLAKNLVRLSGKELGVDAEIVFTGLRPGEKLHEELILEGEDVMRTSHPKVMKLIGSERMPPAWARRLEELIAAAQAGNRLQVIEKLDALVIGYIPAYEFHGVLGRETCCGRRIRPPPSRRSPPPPSPSTDPPAPPSIPQNGTSCKPGTPARRSERSRNGGYFRNMHWHFVSKVITSMIKCNHEGAMVRTQIQLTERQARELKRMAAREGVSMAEVIRKAVDSKIREGVSEVPQEERIRRAMAVMGKFHSGIRDLAVNHDKYLAEDYMK